MQNSNVTIVDYGLGNLLSVERALIAAGAQQVLVSNDPDVIYKSARVVLPGVGAFADGMQGLRCLGLDEAVVRFASSGRPLLGICLGMQLLAHSSNEFGAHLGLNLIDGEVVRIPEESLDSTRMKVPFIGWSALTRFSDNEPQGHFLHEIGDNDFFYFVHSYHFVTRDAADTLAIYRYGHRDITAVVKHENIVGVQFHPEKSARAGILLLSNFLSL